MALQLFRKQKKLTFARTYAAPRAAVWDAWTRPESLREWWGPEHTTVTDCVVDLHVGGRIHIVMEAGEGMGKYRGTRWPMEGTFTAIEPQHRLAYDARSWTEGEQDTSTIRHTNELRLSTDGDSTVVDLQITITEIGPGARMAAFGMKWGYKQYLDDLERHLTS